MFKRRKLTLNIKPNQIHGLGTSLKKYVKRAGKVIIKDNRKGNDTPSLEFKGKCYTKIILSSRQKKVLIEKGVLKLPLSMLNKVMLDPGVESKKYKNEIVVKTIYKKRAKPVLGCSPKKMFTDVSVNVSKAVSPDFCVPPKRSLSWNQNATFAGVCSTHLNTQLLISNTSVGAMAAVNK